MDQQMGKRLGCAALAVQMLLSPVAQAASPLRETMASVIRLDQEKTQAERTLEQSLVAAASVAATEETAFPHVELTASPVETDGDESSTTSPSEPENAETLQALDAVLPPEADPSPGGEDPPTTGLSPGGEDPPTTDLSPGGDDPPGTDASPGGDDPPGTDTSPGGDDPPGTDASPGGEDPPVADASPGGEDPPVTDTSPGEEVLLTTGPSQPGEGTAEAGLTTGEGDLLKTDVTLTDSGSSEEDPSQRSTSVGEGVTEEPAAFVEAEEQQIQLTAESDDGPEDAKEEGTAQPDETGVDAETSPDDVKADGEKALSVKQLFSPDDPVLPPEVLAPSTKKLAASSRITPPLRAEQETMPGYDKIYSVFGFGTEYSIYGEGTYNIETKPGQELDAKYEIIAAQYDGDWNLIPDQNFVYNADGKICFKGVRSTETLPRLPDLRFSDEWYILKRDKVLDLLGKSGEDSNYSELSSSDLQKLQYADSYGDNAKRYDPDRPLSDTYYSGWGDAQFAILMVGKWVDSNNADLTGLSLWDTTNHELKLYPVTSTVDAASKATLTMAGLNELATTTTKTTSELLTEGTTEFFARVSGDVDVLTFSLEAFEPGSTVQVEAQYGGDTTCSYTYSTVEVSGETIEASNSKLHKEIPQRASVEHEALNSYSNPARGLWSFNEGLNIPLSFTSASYKCNEIIFTVTAPDGTTTKTFTVYVQRLTSPEMVLRPGNTPMGMIQRDTNETWTTTKKDDATANFMSGNRAFRQGTTDLAPQDATNNFGHIQKKSYLVSAWGQNVTAGSADDLDLDPGTIVVYQNSAFQIPYYSVWNGLGDEKEKTGSPGPDIDLTWEIEFTTVTKLGPEAATDTVGSSETLTYQGTKDVDMIDLTGKNVKPGVYQLRYTYKDPYDNQTYTGGSFVRNVVVLPLRGDVDMDGAVTVADGISLQNLLSAGFFDDVKAGTCTDVAKCLYYYRVCDVAGESNGIVDQSDVDALLNGFAPQLTRSDTAASDYFYIPLAGDTERTRTGAPATAVADKASLSLRYLGVGTDASNLTEQSVNYDPNDLQVFWVEARLADTDKLPASLEGDLTSLTLTLTYDPTYLEPYRGSYDDWIDYILSVNTQWSGWTALSSGAGITPAAHASKALPGLEEADETVLREIRFSVTKTDGGAALADGSVLKVPFRLKAFSSDKTNSTARLVELTLGMRDLTVTTTTGSATWNNGDNEQALRSVTTDLMDDIQYVGSDPIPLGEDLTPCYVVYAQGTTNTNAVYGTAFTSGNYGYAGDTPERLPTFSTDGEVTIREGRLPTGVTYHRTGYVYGTPEEAGTFDFYVGDSTIPFRLIVEKVPLTLTVQNVTKYYGETATTVQTFTYDTTQIKALDTVGGKTNSGKANDLTNLIAEYVAPTITLVTDVTTGTPVTAQTVPGTYTVRLAGGSSKNYSFRYVQTGSTTLSDTYGTAKLTILSRPIRINQVTKNPALSILENADPDAAYWRSAQYIGNGAENEFTFADLDGSRKDTNGYYDGKAPLTVTAADAVVGEDSLEIEYYLTAVPLSKDKSTEFTLDAPTETRSATVYQVRLTGALQDGNYVLENPIPVTTSATVQVSKRVMTKVTVSHAPSTMTYTYGKRLNLQNLVVDIEFADGGKLQATNRVEYCEKQGLTVQWVDGQNVVPSSGTDRVAEDDEQLNVPDYNEKWLCITGTGETRPRAWVGPFKVNKATMTLTIQGKARYYGEKIKSWTVGYDFSQLIPWDMSIFSTGTLNDLGALCGWEDPTISTRKTASLSGEEVTAATDTGIWYVLISGAESSNYQFEYTRTPIGGGATTKEKSFGYAPLTVYPRPILVTKINTTAGSLYHDSDTYVIPQSTATATATAEKPGFDTILPESSGTYYSNGYESGDPAYQIPSGLSLSRTPIYSDDTVAVTYRSEFAHDTETKGEYFTMGAQEHKTYDVAVTDLALSTIGNSRNYVLLHTTPESAENGWVGTTAAGSKTFGDVYLRKIEEMQIVSGPTKTDYVYGSLLNLEGMQVRLKYENSETLETVRYADITVGGVATNSFAQRGLRITWEGDNDPVSNRQQISVARHNGRHLVVTGPTYIGRTPIVQTTSEYITVQKKALTLTVVSQERYYGEENGIYEFTFDTNDLVEWDQSKVGANPAYGSTATLEKPVNSAALIAVNADYILDKTENKYVGPRFSTSATKKSDAQTTPYPLTLSGGSMANYVFHFVDGGITVDKRPISVVSVNKNPIYILSQDALSNTGPTERTTTCYVGEFTDDQDNVTNQTGLTLGMGTSGLSGEPLVEGDGVAVSMTVKYSQTKNVVAFGAGEYEKNVDIDLLNLQLVQGGDSDNYKLTATTPEQNYTTKAVIHKREIESVRITRLPSKLNYTYGETMSLNGMVIEITYAAAGTQPAYSISVTPDVLDEVNITYWSGALPAKEELSTVVNSDHVPSSVVTEHRAATGDHLTIARDSSGFAQNGMYLMVSAQKAVNQPFVEPVLSTRPIRVAPLELTYTLAAEDKDYDTTGETQGTIKLTNVYGHDKVWVVNGTDYNSVPLPDDYSFHSSANYGEGVTYTFVDPNVKWQVAEHDNYADVLQIPAEVTNITIDGADSPNYAINNSVTTSTTQISGRDGVPYATISPIERDAPETEVRLWVDEHTNTVTVEPLKPVSDFYVAGDQKNSQMHYEYALLYLEGDTLVQTDYQDSPYFGGEKVTVDVPVFEPEEEPEERPEGTGGGQTINENDPDFGNRTPLPRGTYVSALVRLSPTNNYFVSNGTASVTNDTSTTTTDPETGEEIVTTTKSLITVDNAASNDTVKALIEDAYTAAKTADENAGFPKEGEEEDDRLIEREPGPIIKTYTYRIDLVSTSEEKDVNGDEFIVPILEQVWFTDVATFKDDKEMDRLIVNNEPALYFGYYWDPKQTVRVEFGEDKFDLSQEMTAKLPVENEDGSRTDVETVVNANNTVRFYVPVVRRGGSIIINPKQVTISPAELIVREGDDPIQLELEFAPLGVMNRQVTWSSSDESVVVVSGKGLVTIVGPGTAEITVTTFNGITDTILVQVLGKNEGLSPFVDTMFNVMDEEPYMDVDEEGLFHPQDTMTRHELIVIMEHFFRTVTSIQPTAGDFYADVSSSEDYVEQLRTLDAWGIVEGVGHNLFAPDRIATRAEAATILCRMLMLPIGNDQDAPHAFADSGPEDTWAWPYIDALAAAGITKGTGGGNFSPNKPVTRAELATFIARILITRVDIHAENLVIPADVPEGHWAYDAILRAVNSGAVLLYTDPKRSDPGSE